jgi:hypothetical protein
MHSQHGQEQLFLTYALKCVKEVYVSSVTGSVKVRKRGNDNT